jgi:hypothetical protein
MALVPPLAAATVVMATIAAASAKMMIKMALWQPHQVLETRAGPRLSLTTDCRYPSPHRRAYLHAAAGAPRTPCAA